MKITERVALLVATAAVLPLVTFGIVAIKSIHTGTRESVLAGNRDVAARGASQIEQYVAHSVNTLQSAAAEVEGTFLYPWQQERILRNYVLTFPEFREIALFDGGGRVMSASRLGPTSLSPARPESMNARGVAISPIEIDDDLLPRTSVTVRVPAADGPPLWLVGELRLEEMWRLVDRLRVGRTGVALLMDERGRLIAHGDPDEKPRVARGENVLGHPLARMAMNATPRRILSTEYMDPRRHGVLAVAAPLPSLGWTLIAEQPVEEAYAIATRLERQLVVSISFALLLTVGLGYFWGRSLIRPITALMHGTQAVAAGRLDTRVALAGADEFHHLGESFNAMAERLAALQDETRRQERQAMFGRIAAGLVHDLAHPLQNIGNNCRLMLKMYDDAEYRETFRRTVERELQTLRRVIEDLRNLARPIPLERFPIDVGRSLGEIVESMATFAAAAGVTLEYQPPAGPLAIEGDVFALGRVYRNLILNAIQATAPGGRITVSAERRDGHARMRVADTGCGIPAERLTAIFEDFVTTKRRGLGLGLPIAKKIVDQMHGTIGVRSTVGEGTIFEIEFPSTEPQHADAAAS